MKKKIKYSIFILLLLIFTNGCASLKDGLEGNKRSKTSEEFLIEKKNPLVLPPDFDALPLPTSKTKIDNKNKDEFNIDNVLDNPPKKITGEQKTNISLEKSIIEKIQSK
ncbi:DUF3035 domain-containing protein [Candidatus Pelagibacter sp.]|nr:DUF3035 domain-containing protein [Candidatus Pelagibacter sp.]